MDLSFDTISAYGANAAMMHYSATPEDHATLAPEGMLLVDSGGHYLGGTTDITRTIVLGPISDEDQKDVYAGIKGTPASGTCKISKRRIRDQSGCDRQRTALGFGLRLPLWRPDMA